MHFVKGKEGILSWRERKKKKSIGQNLKTKKKVLEASWERNPEKSFIHGQDWLKLK